MILRSSYFMIRRMLRSYLSFAILLVMPLVIISVLGLIAGDAFDEVHGITVMAGIAVTMILAFQLYGGFYTLEFIRDDLLGPKKWRIYSLPYPPSTHGLSIILSCSLFSALQGIVMVLYTQVVYGVSWGNIGLVTIVLLALSTFCQLVYLSIAFGVKEYKTAERLGTAFGLVSIGLAGVWFPMPEKLRFLSIYGNPLSLSRNAVYSIMSGEQIQLGLISFGVLILASVLTAVLAIFLGRRRLAS